MTTSYEDWCKKWAPVIRTMDELLLHNIFYEPTVEERLAADCNAYLEKQRLLAEGK